MTNREWVRLQKRVLAKSAAYARRRIQNAGVKLSDKKIERLESDNKYLRRDCAQLSERNQERLKLKRLIAEALDHVNEHHNWFTSTAAGATWIKNAKAAIL